MNLDGLDVEILGPAFLAGLLVLTTHVPLGQQVLARGIIFLDLAVAQIAALGLIIAANFGWQSGGWQMQVIAVSAALVGAWLLYLSEKHWADVQEAIIGCVFVLAASAGILLLSSNPHGGEQLKELLAGQILWVSYDQLLPVALLYAAVLALWFSQWFKRYLQQYPILFYALFAVTITTSVQLVGIYLVFASLIIPALAVRHVVKNGLRIAYLLGIAGYVGGLLFSVLLDLPSGVSIVWTLAFCGIFGAVMISVNKKGTKQT
ncbi:MAG: metal ABC transporter permease [Thiotrichaceae bacterium]|nr:metal ABC transporter permease [Thiotrichaceae bacterium]PCI12099.1 MAG: zinc/manganese transporter permease [Thiotrichales bacterium]